MTKLALVHDWLNQVGGAEDVIAEMVGMFPGAPLYTSIYWRDEMPPAWQQWPIRALWIDRVPGIHRHHQRYLPLYPLAFGGLDLRAYDVVLSNKSGFCHGVKTRPDAVHVCYCLAPTRYVWQFDSYMAREQVGGALRSVVRPLIAALRRWDYAAAQRVKHFIAISTEIQDRIQRFYHRESVVIYPPVDVAERFAPAPREEIGDYYFILSRLIPYKRIDLAIEACNRLGLPLLIAGRGRDRERLEALAGPTVKLLGFVSDEEAARLMARCKAFLFPGLEDFGITPVQAAAAGRPTIAYRGGGSLDTVIPGQTGEFFDTPEVDSLVVALERFETANGARARDPYDPSALRAHAMRFDRRVFREALAGFLREKAGWG